MNGFIGFKAVVLAAGIGAAALAGCASAQQPTAPAKPAPITQAVQAGDPNEYRLGTGDEIKITVVDQPTLSGPFVVDGRGTIQMAMIGEVQVKDHTLREVQAMITAKLKDGWINEPLVTADMTKGRPFYISGEINRPGEYPYTPGLTVMKAITAAGDFTYRANKNEILIKPADGDAEKKVKLTVTTPVHPGDTIRIKERFF